MSTKKHNPHGRFHVLIKKMKGADKEDLVWKYSDMLTTSLPELLEKHPAKYNRMLNDMQGIVNAASKAKTENTPEQLKNEIEQLKHEKKCSKQRSFILVVMRDKIGVDTSNWQSINQYTRQAKIFGKTLGEMSLDELELGLKKVNSIGGKEAKTDGSKRLSKLPFSQN